MRGRRSQTVDLMFAGIAPDGAMIYDTPSKAVPMQIACDLVQRYPGGAAITACFCFGLFAGLIGVCVWYAENGAGRRPSPGVNGWRRYELCAAE